MSQQFHYQNDTTRVISSSLLDNPSLVFCARFGKFQRKDTQCQAFVKRVIMSRLFKIMMISIVSLNAFFVVLWTDYNTKYNLFRLFEVSELVFVSIYSSEFCMKLYVDPINYWKDGYNLLDVIIIITIFIPYGLRRFKGKHYPYLNIADGMQSLRILKLITYSRGIRTLITAVGQTAYIVASVLILLFLLMYIFAILGFCLFGVPDKGDPNNWGNLAVAFFTLFSLATVDGWTDLQEQLDSRNLPLSRTFTITFILLASFVFLSMFVGVMIIHTEDSIKKFERELMLERHVTLMEEKQVIVRRQQEEVSKLMQMQKNADYKSFSELVENFKKTLRHTDPMVLDDFGTSLPFIDVYLSTLDNQDTTVYKLQELYYEIVHVLSLMLEDLPQKKQSQSSEKADEK
ncbi:cation channel sperm-associated protein 3 isoform X1 [Canis lupus baileyi]|uniref:Cation channel sperm associated 3 n=4 Tax=Canis lupus TaxID=9612 RepID=A0A8C0S469_CANLF|nr:cation channel sperm-associated protein 3 isoform X1 [Canis lupus dingo]XP_038408135.1 cation channel sperm-associated protein 3 isoform X2 [Canis lupus familiaris]XP_038537492.1 cation channel sperm-associated protein 3 isoform X2 [Canis lupus familiaris]XP_538633.3 cation channel sperm-associated protein 3 isoform X2 [Canis lupus familiaris]|eukprot:XP_538633.3 cation channel sperm-associated protein 3 isoform X1 [Canis lupus familiaris]